MTESNGPRIWVPRVRILESELRGPVAGVEGYMILEACNRYGQPRRRMRWKQVITDIGMANIWLLANGTLHNYAGVGTGTTPFTGSSTALSNQVGSRTNSTVSATVQRDTMGSSGYREVLTATKQFTLGAITGNITEVGFFTGSSGNNATFLDLVRDEQGDPTTFPVTSEDQLRVTHVLYAYPFLGEADGSFTIGGSAGSGSHDYVCSMAGLNLDSGYTLGVFGRTDCAYAAYRDVTDLGSVTDLAFGDGTFIGNSVHQDNPSLSDDGIVWTQTHQITVGLSVWNHVNGISGIRVSNQSGGITRRGYKFMIDPPIPKFEDEVQRILTLTFTSGVTRV